LDLRLVERFLDLRLVERFLDLRLVERFLDLRLVERFLDLRLVERFLDLRLVERFLDLRLVERFLDLRLVERFLDLRLVERFLDLLLVERFLVLRLYPFPIWVLGEFRDGSDFDFDCKLMGDVGGVKSESETDLEASEDKVVGFSSDEAIDAVSVSLSEIGLRSGNLRNPRTFNILGHSSIVSEFVLLLLIITILLEINFS
jgi:hypothetical protein